MGCYPARSSHQKIKCGHKGDGHGQQQYKSWHLNNVQLVLMAQIVPRKISITPPQA